jgi:hypothetical protein
MSEAERRVIYEATCLLDTPAMRERLIRTGQILPRPDDPEELALHLEWKSKQTKGV